MSQTNEAGAASAYRDVTEPIPREVIVQYLAQLEDQADLSQPLDQFRENFVNESDIELERKRGICRNRILANYERDDAERRITILTKIIQDNVKRRAEFERHKESAAWKRTVVEMAGAIVGAIVGVIVGVWIGGG